MHAIHKYEALPMFSHQGIIYKYSHFFAYAINVVLLLSHVVILTGCATAPTIDASLQDSALAGNAQAQYKMGEIYYKARYATWGRSVYWEDAAYWYKMAADQGDARAYYRLSQYYFNRRSDYNQSFIWLQFPAQQGIAEAQHHLGMHYAQAWGTPQNLTLAYKWIALAYGGDISNPSGRVVSLESLIRRGKMTPEQVSEGQRLAAEHIASHGRSWAIDPGRRTLLEMR